MNRYLFVMWEGGGTGPPELAVARRLIARGHIVHVLGDPTIEAGARAIGASFSSWRNAPHVRSLQPEDALVRDWEIRNPLTMFRTVRDALICGPTRLFADETLAAIDEHRPDVVAPDMMMIGGMIAAEKAGIPQAILTPNLYPFPTKGRPMIGSGSMPATGALGRLRDALMARLFTRLFDGGLPPINETRSAHGLPPLQHTFEQHDRAERVLVLSSEAFDFPGPPLPANVRYVGAQLDDPSWAAPWQPPWPDDDSRPLVLVAFSSTFQAQLPLLQRIAVAIGQLPVRGLITLGPALVGQTFTAPDNVHVVATAPHAQVIPRARIVVTHCGHGTTLKALSHGTPLLCLPMGRDQVDNAARTVWHGAGIRLKSSASVGAIKSALDRLLDNDLYAARARSLAEQLRHEHERDRAVDELESLASYRSR